MTPQRLEEIRERAELSRKRDWVVSREAIADIDGLLEHVGELQGAARQLLEAIPLADEDNMGEVICELCSDNADCKGWACDSCPPVRLQKLIGGSGE